MRQRGGGGGGCQGVGGRIAEPNKESFCWVLHLCLVDNQEYNLIELEERGTKKDEVSEYQHIVILVITGTT